MGDNMYAVGISFIVLYGFLILDWHARRVFLACGYCRRYGHGKSWNRAKKHYKCNWTFFQRLLWVHAFREKYEIEFRMIAYLSFAHVGVSLLTLLLFYINEFVFPSIIFWQYGFVFFTVFTILRFIYDNRVATR